MSRRRGDELRNRSAYQRGDGIDREMLTDIARAQLSMLDWLTAIDRIGLVGEAPEKPGRDHHG